MLNSATVQKLGIGMAMVLGYATRTAEAQQALWQELTLQQLWEVFIAAAHSGELILANEALTRLTKKMASFEEYEQVLESAMRTGGGGEKVDTIMIDRMIESASTFEHFQLLYGRLDRWDGFETKAQSALNELEKRAVSFSDWSYLLSYYQRRQDAAKVAMIEAKLPHLARAFNEHQHVYGATRDAEQRAESLHRMLVCGDYRDWLEVYNWVSSQPSLKAVACDVVFARAATFDQWQKLWEKTMTGDEQRHALAWRGMMDTAKKQEERLFLYHHSGQQPEAVQLQLFTEVLAGADTVEALRELQQYTITKPQLAQRIIQKLRELLGENS